MIHCRRNQAGELLIPHERHSLRKRFHKHADHKLKLRHETAPF